MNRKETAMKKEKKVNSKVSSSKEVVKREYSEEEKRRYTQDLHKLIRKGYADNG